FSRQDSQSSGLVLYLGTVPIKPAELPPNGLGLEPSDVPLNDHLEGQELRALLRILATCRRASMWRAGSRRWILRVMISTTLPTMKQQRDRLGAGLLFEWSHSLKKAAETVSGLPGKISAH